MIEDEKIKTIKYKDIISEYLYTRGISESILEHPRYESILWKLSNIIRKAGISSLDDIKCKLGSLIEIDINGNITILERNDSNQNAINSKYCFYSEEDSFRRVIIEYDKDRKEKKVNSSNYNNDGIETSLAIRQDNDEQVIFTKVSRSSDRIDVIKLEKIIQDKKSGKFVKVKDMYKIRNSMVALEDIYPTAEDIDPFDIMHFSTSEIPKMYRDLTLGESQIVKNNDEKFFPLTEQNREKQFQDYKKMNDTYNRTKCFEEAVASYLDIKDYNKDLRN